MAKAKAVTPDIDVNAEVTSAIDDIRNTPGSNLVAQFFTQLAPFFGKATELERKSGEILTVAKATKPPTNAADDAAIQVCIRKARDFTKEVEEHWSITQAFHQLHRKLTSARGRPVAAITEAQGIWQRLHNAYVDAETRRAREEEARITREREQALQAARDRELADLEARAVAAEEASGELSDRERVFVDRYFETGNARAAATTAGFKDPLKSAARLITLPKIITAVNGKRTAAELRRQAAAEADLPLMVGDVTVKPDVRAVGSDRETWRAEVIDERAFVEAVIGGRHGIPADCLTINQGKLTGYAKSMHDLINRWPGVKAVKSTNTI